MSEQIKNTPETTEKSSELNLNQAFGELRGLFNDNKTDINQILEYIYETLEKSTKEEKKLISDSWLPYLNDHLSIHLQTKSKVSQVLNLNHESDFVSFDLLWEIYEITKSFQFLKK